MTSRSRFVGVLAALIVSTASSGWAQDAATAPEKGQETQAAEGKAPAEVASKYVRVVEDKKGILTLEIATRSFRRSDGTGPTIHLVGAVHIADKSFYQAKQEELDRSDVVLFEGVKASGMADIAKDLDDAAKADATRKRIGFLAQLASEARRRTGAFATDLPGLATDSGRFRRVVEGLGSDGWGAPIAMSMVDLPATDSEPAKQQVRFVSLGSDGKAGGEGTAADIAVESEAIRTDSAAQGKKSGANIQSKLAQVLGVSFQLDEMDSGKANWRNSDIDIDALRKRLDEAGPNAGMILRMLEGSSFEAKLANLLLSLIGVSKTLSAATKVIMLDQLANADELMGQAGVPGLEAMQEIIIGDRNRIVLDDLKALVEREPEKKSIAIFYGAGHMASMERCLMAEFGVVPQGIEWTPAMRVDPAESGMTKAQVQQMRAWMTKAIKRQQGK
jgi:hypothetical protein